MQKSEYTQWVFTCSKSTMKTLEQGAQSAQSLKNDTGMTSLTWRH